MQNNIKISIPKPCHEDWDAMTPNEKGSFCGKCCKTVIDFSNKTIEEIQHTLLSKKGEKVCGRFMNHQLDEPETKQISLKIPLYILPKNLSYQKAFAIALFFVFGTGLFSCITPENHMVGEISIVDTIPSKVFQVNDSTTHEMFLGNVVTDKSNIIKPDKSEIKMGKPKANVCEPKETYEKIVMKGEIKVETGTVKKDSIKHRPKMGKIDISK